MTRDDIFLLFGKAVYRAQFYEDQLAKALAAIHELKHANLTAATADAIREKLEVPLGGLLKEMDKTYSSTDVLKRFLDEVKDDRNYLAHHFFRDFAMNYDLGSDFTLEAQKLQTIIDKIELASGMIEQMTGWPRVHMDAQRSPEKVPSAVPAAAILPQ